MNIREKPDAVLKRNAMVYGPPKTGKTLAAALAPPPVLYVNADLPNATWLAHHSVPEGHLLEPLFDAKQNPTFTLMQEIEVAANTGKTENIETVVLDPINELYLRLLRELSGNAISPSLPTYQAVQSHLERLCRALCNCTAINVVFVTHDLPTKDEGTGKIVNLPATGTTNPALGRKLMGMVDVLAYAQKIEQEGQPDRYMARVADRFNVLDRIEPLDLNHWFEKMANDGPSPVVRDNDQADDSAKETK
jgi:hypothetical protein